MDGTVKPAITFSLRRQCSALVFEVAAKHNVPPVLITAHVKHSRACPARREVMAVMISQFGMRRWQVAEAFGRDLRRVRRSVIGV